MKKRSASLAFFASFVFLACTPPVAKQPDLSVVVKLVDVSGREIASTKTIDAGTGDVKFTIDEAIDLRIVRPEAAAADGVSVAVSPIAMQPLAWAVKASDASGNSKEIKVAASLADGLVTIGWSMSADLAWLGTSELGAMLMDAKRQFAEYADGDVDFCLVNAGTIKTDLASGTVTRAKLKTTFPYDNKHVIAEITGQQLQEALDYGMGRGGLTSFPLVSEEITFTSRMDADGNFSAFDVRLNGVPIDSAKVYRMLSDDFFVQPDTAKTNGGYSMLRDLPVIARYEITTRELMYSYLAMLGSNPEKPAKKSKMAFDFSAFSGTTFYCSVEGGTGGLQYWAGRGRYVASVKARENPGYVAELRLERGSFQLSTPSVSMTMFMHPSLKVSGGWIDANTPGSGSKTTIAVRDLANTSQRIVLTAPGTYLADNIVIDLNGRTLTDAVLNSTTEGYSVSGTCELVNAGP